MPGPEPTGLTLVAYQVGFGDCFLLTVRYPEARRHLLVDFGTTGLPDGFPREQAVHLQRVALDVERRVGSDPFAVVATHRHADHVSGFATDARLPARSGGEKVVDRRTSGEIIRGLTPRLVLQPWTEDPALPADATGPALARTEGGFRALLAQAGTVSALARKEGETLRAALASSAFDATVARELGFLGGNNLSNLSAVKNLQAMGKAGAAVFAHYGSDPGLADLLPGVTATVLGPPTLRQSAEVRKQRRSDPDEFWGLQARLHAWLAGQEAMLASADVAATVRRTARGRTAGRGPFPRALVHDPTAPLPPLVRQFKRRALQARGEQLLELVRALDKVLNNTSLILLLEVGGQRLLFPGDAQLENWSHALFGPDAERNRRLLAGTDLYKVGHHGSLNATPRSLWSLFEKRGPGRRTLRSVVSTLEGVHGDEAARTEVPRRTLVAALKKETGYFTTQSLRRELCREADLDLGAKRPRWSGWRAPA